MKLAKNQMVPLLILGVVAVAGVVLLLSLGQVKSSKKKGAPDPAAEVRKKYQAAQEGEKNNAPKGESKREEVKKEAVSTDESSSETKTKTDERGEVRTIVPSESALMQAPPPAPDLPPINAPSDEGKGQAVDSGGTGTAQLTEVPKIPEGLIGQTPPEGAETTEKPPIPAKYVITPGRYLFNNLTSDALGGGGLLYASKGASYAIDYFSPQGEVIDIALMNTVAGNNFDVPVSAAVWTPFYFQGHRLLKRGDKLLGMAAAGKTRDRLIVNFNRVILKSGKSIPLNAIALDEDGTAGVKGYIVGNTLLQILGPALAEAGSAFLSSMSDSQTTTTTGPYGVVTTQTTKNNLTSAAGQAGQKIATRIAEALKQDIEENKPYVLVPAGTRARAYLLAPIDVSIADYGK
ncbi:MAG: TrbI/VirB10 family protein [bacterium]